jgi:segregation and condensation protein A
MNVYQVKLPVFEGPFDLLYHLIEEQKINIYDIPIAHITNQYLEYLQIIEILDMEVASSFLIMAATLLEIKSKMLLPKERDQEFYDEGYDDYPEDDYEGEDARLGLVEKLIEYKKFKLIALELRKLEAEASRIYTRFSVSERRPEEILEVNIGPIDLLNIYHALIKTRVSPPIHRVVVDRLGVEDRILEIRRYLKSFKKEIDFTDLLKDPNNKENKVVSFMAILEMIKAGELDFSQEDAFAPIILSKLSKNPSLTVAAANS